MIDSFLAASNNHGNLHISSHYKITNFLPTPLYVRIKNKNETIFTYCLLTNSEENIYVSMYSEYFYSISLTSKSYSNEYLINNNFEVYLNRTIGKYF